MKLLTTAVTGNNPFFNRLSLIFLCNAPDFYTTWSLWQWCVSKRYEVIIFINSYCNITCQLAGTPGELLVNVTSTSNGIMIIDCGST